MVQNNTYEIHEREPKCEPAYRQLYELLKQRIASGRLKPGDQLPTESLLLEKYRVSRNTVRHALSGLERDNLIVRFPRKGTFVRHAPEGGSETQKYTVGVTFFREDASATFYGPLTRGVLAAAKKNNLIIRVVPLRGDENYDELDGCLFNYELRPETSIYKRIAKGIMPAVGYNFRIGRKCGFVGVDYYAESFKAVRHLIESGCRRIAFWGKTADRFGVYGKRFEGYCDALKEAGLEVSESSVAFSRPGRSPYEQALDFLKKKSFDSIFVAAAHLFPSVLFAMNHLKLSIASDLRLLCFDDLAQEKLAWPGFHYIRMPLHEIGYTMMDALYQQMILREKAKPIDRIFPAELVTVPELAEQV